MPNLYVGTGSSQFTGDDTDTLRSGYDKKATDTKLATLPTGGAVKGGTGMTGSGWGSFTGCGGMIAKTATQVFVLHSAPGGKTFSADLKNALSWLSVNKDSILMAVFIGFGMNANPPVFATLMTSLAGRAATETVPKAVIQHIRRNGNKSLKASANLNGVCIVSGPKQEQLLNTTWGSLSSGSTTQS